MMGMSPFPTTKKSRQGASGGVVKHWVSVLAGLVTSGRSWGGGGEGLNAA